jgi:hypothetical protein
MKCIFNAFWMSVILWSIIYTVATAPWHSCDTTEAERLKREVVTLEDMIKRDDVLLDTFMDGSWKRDCKYRVVPWHQLADGTIRQSLIQECDDERK